MFSLLALKPKTNTKPSHMSMVAMCTVVLKELQYHGFIGNYAEFDSTKDRGVMTGNLITGSTYEIELDKLGSEIRLAFNIVRRDNSNYVGYFPTAVTEKELIGCLESLRQHIEEVEVTHV